MPKSNIFSSVTVKPSFATPPPAELEKDYGSNVEIPCQAVGTPSPNVEWYYNTVAISELGDARYVSFCVSIWSIIMSFCHLMISTHWQGKC